MLIVPNTDWSSLVDRVDALRREALDFSIACQLLDDNAASCG